MVSHNDRYQVFDYSLAKVGSLRFVSMFGFAGSFLLLSLFVTITIAEGYFDLPWLLGCAFATLVTTGVGTFFLSLRVFLLPGIKTADNGFRLRVVLGLWTSTIQWKDIKSVTGYRESFPTAFGSLILEKELLVSLERISFPWNIAFTIIPSLRIGFILSPDIDDFDQLVGIFHEYRPDLWPNGNSSNRPT